MEKHIDNMQTDGVPDSVLSESGMRDAMKDHSK